MNPPHVRAPGPPARRRATSDLHARILAVVARIPAGRVAFYGQVAALAGIPRHPRLVGYALHALPTGTPLPWHRVLNARGGLSLPPSGSITQRLRLEREGVQFDARGRVALERFGWRPRGGGARTARARPGASRRGTSTGARTSGSMRPLPTRLRRVPAARSGP